MTKQEWNIVKRARYGVTIGFRGIHSSEELQTLRRKEARAAMLAALKDLRLAQEVEEVCQQEEDDEIIFW